MKDLIMAKATRACQRLAALKPSELRRRAEALGLGPRRVAQAEDQPDPKVAFVKLLLRTGPAPTSDVSKAPLSPLPQTPPEYGESSPKFSHMSMSPEVHQVGDAAATRIQANVRGSATRQRLAQEAEAASTIQRNVRQHQSKRRSIDIERDEAKVAAAKRSTKLLKEEQKVLQQLKADMAILKARDLRRLAEDWGCESSQLLRAEEDEQPKVAVRRLVLDRARVVTAQLQELPVPELKQRAKAAGCSDEEVEQAEDGEEPKVALFRLICSDLLKLQQTVSARETSAALQVPELAHAFMDLKAALEKQRPKQLAKVLRSTGCRPAELQEVEDDEKPKERMKQMILDLAREVLNEFHGMTAGRVRPQVKVSVLASTGKKETEFQKRLTTKLVDKKGDKVLKDLRGERFNVPKLITTLEEGSEVDWWPWQEVGEEMVPLAWHRKMSELKNFAVGNGVSSVEIEDCADAEMPKVALTKLLLSRMPFHPSQFSSTPRNPRAGDEIFSFNMDLNDSVDTPEIDKMSEIDKAFVRMKVELEKMKVTELKQRAFIYGCTDETIDDALDQENPKVALGQLILEVARDARDALLEMRFTELKQGDGWFPWFVLRFCMTIRRVSKEMWTDFRPQIDLTQLTSLSDTSSFGQNCRTDLNFVDNTFMTLESIVSLTAAISIAFNYLEPVQADLTVAQTMQESRIAEFDHIITGCKALLQQCGRPRYLESIWLLWTQLSQSLYMMERALWPEQAPETPLHIALPPEARPLSDILLDVFDP
ncbi:unnamed protein product [Cladocopium goreaui]|uniref:Uncharacterized protein n=1 Tax=Cladocopium goreaui TaxID=2562237 RepID=A0A9P1BNC8_9DINO|nr:unnamed protein product [Cladocopium goreaui]